MSTLPHTDSTASPAETTPVSAAVPAAAMPAASAPVAAAPVAAAPTTSPDTTADLADARLAQAAQAAPTPQPPAQPAQVQQTQQPPQTHDAAHTQPHPRTAPEGISLTTPASETVTTRAYTPEPTDTQNAYAAFAHAVLSWANRTARAALTRIIPKKGANGHFFAAPQHNIDNMMPATSPGHNSIDVHKRRGTDARRGADAQLIWGARSDVGLVREHNEDSFLVQPPVFAVCDGMGGHEAGEVASFIAVDTIGKNAPLQANDVLLGAAVESANTEIITQAQHGVGRPGMGCTASAVVIENNKLAVAHVGDSRVYLLHHGCLVRLTHDHSFVEELVDAGEITADEARVHPKRSYITRALGSDPNMYADHFTIDVTIQDRVIICSDGLSSMIEDSQIEALAVSSAHPQNCADNLVAAALQAGGYDNVSVVVIDIKDDGVLEQGKKLHRKRFAIFGALAGITLVVLFLAGILLVNSSWYLASSNGKVCIYQGINAKFLGLPLSHLSSTTSITVTDLPAMVQESLERGLRVDSEAEARTVVENYRDQINEEKSAAAVAANRAANGTQTSPANPAEPQDTGDAAADTSGATDTSDTASASGASFSAETGGSAARDASYTSECTSDCNDTFDNTAATLTAREVTNHE
jgi:hypothetical protein